MDCVCVVCACHVIYSYTGGLITFTCRIVNGIHFELVYSLAFKS